MAAHALRKNGLKAPGNLAKRAPGITPVASRWRRDWLIVPHHLAARG